MTKSKRRKRRHPIDIKVENKRLTKLAKKGTPLKKRDRRFRRALKRRAHFDECRIQDEQLDKDLLEARQVRYSDDDELDEEPLPLDMLDPDYDFTMPTQQASDDEEAKDDVDVYEDFESERHSKKQRQSIDKKERLLLPLKTISGKLILVKESNEEPALSEPTNAGCSTPQLSVEDEKPPDLISVYATRQKILNDCKTEIATVCSQVIANPGENISRLKRLFDIVHGRKYPEILLTAGKLTIASLTRVFVDVVPGYSIRAPSSKEMAQQMKKETKKIWEYEQSLLSVYRKYLQLLEKLIRRVKGNRQQVINEQLGILALKQYSVLLLRHPHFNYRNNILVVLIPLMNCKDATVRTIACNTFYQLFDEDATGEVSLDAVKYINQFMRKKSSRIRPEMLDTLLHLRLMSAKNSASAKEETKSSKGGDPFRNMSGRKRKYYKSLRRLQYDLKEIDAEEAELMVQKHHTKIVEHLFNIYFRILRRQPERTLLRPVLAGLSKFAHLINVDFFDSLIASMRTVLNLSDLSVLDSLHSIHTVLMVLSNEGEALNIDPYFFQNFLYALIPKMMAEKRRGSIPLNRVAGFVKRVSENLETMKQPELVASLLAIRSYFMSHPRLECMIDDDEEECAPGLYNAKSNDLEHCGAISSKLDVLRNLQTHPSKLVRQIAVHILSNFPSKGKGALLPELTKEAPETILQKLSGADI
ncbi:nucleolar complex associated protein [Trichuris trichiura]|uniref:NOC3-like protein n=1 Tax=Trichuris trichiura TaxID=36087 RepID=A0A077ZIA1_TRITR|nr:nucleolar complex associated protein [Trichuris trichiura]